MLSETEISHFQKEILEWYTKNKRDLPWRKSRNPYYIIISEVMSQQTQISRVVPKFENWMRKFPTIQSLANANVSEVLQYWSGLGYNRRALYLKKTATKIVNEFNGIFPRTEKELVSLPGIGTYTARAILCFAFDMQVVLVDTNIRKVIITKFLQSEVLGEQHTSDLVNLKISDSEKSKSQRDLNKNNGQVSEILIEELAKQLLPKGLAYDWNQALMDYASEVLKKEKIVIPKQSKFRGSNRYVRGQVLNILITQKRISIIDLLCLIKKNFETLEKDWLLTVLEDLECEGFLVIKKNTVMLVS